MSSRGEREFSKDNKTLGRFDLTGIAQAPRGVPQIEVTFDIDANGIVNVSAVDKATGKSQEIKITAGSGLSEEEVERMVKEAEANKEVDKKRREVVDTRNNLDAMILSCEKTLKEAGDKIAEADKKELEGGLASAREKLTSENLDELKGELERLQNLSHKVATQMYSQGQGPTAEGGQKADEPRPKTDEPSKPKGPKDEEVVDADFKEV